LRLKLPDPISLDGRWWIIATAAVGAVLGSKILGCMEQAPEIVHRWRNRAYLVSGKSIVGGLLGGWMPVEWIKRRLGITVSTGDLFAAPLAVEVAIGRIGCFLAGLPDQTCGIATTLPWGVDFGDGVLRHPTQLYEMAFLLTLSLALWRFLRQPHRNGDVFKLFIAGYMGWRLHPLVCCAGYGVVLRPFPNLRVRQEAPPMRTRNYSQWTVVVPAIVQVETNGQHP
jgi:phosphatidylglycerol---prolipoprotein diacylglyceryl transferase